MVDFFCRENILPVLVGAGENTKNYADEFCKAYPETINLVGKCTLRETYAVMKQCDLFLGGDTGPMHMASAAEMSGAVLFFTHYEPEFPIRFEPRSRSIRLLQCEYAISSNLNSVILVEAVIDSLKNVLECEC